MTALTLDLVRGLPAGQGWPLPSAVGPWVQHEAIGWDMSLVQFVTQFPAETHGGFYDKAICPTCHGSGSSCDLCGGSGRVCARCRNYGHVYPAEWGRAVPCGQCDTLRRAAAQRAEMHWAQHGLTEAEKRWTFEGGIWLSSRWDAHLWIDDFRTLANWMERWAAEPTLDGRSWIVMIDEAGLGNNGMGKSYLGTAVVNRRLAQGQPAYKWQTGELFDCLREQLAPRSSGLSYAEWFRALCKFPGVLFLDEFGGENLTEWVRERFVILLTYRAERTWLPTILAGNVSRSEICATLPFLASRLEEGRVFRPEMSRFPVWRPLLKKAGGTLPDSL